MAGKKSEFWTEYEPVLRKLAAEGMSDREIFESGKIPVDTRSKLTTARQRYGIAAGDAAKARAATRDYKRPASAAPAPEEPAEKPDPTNAEIARLESALRAAQDDLSHTRSKLKTAQRDSVLFDALAQVIRETTEPLPAGKPTPVRKRAVGATPVDGVLVMSDEHADQRISAAGTWGLEQYDFDTFRCRLARLVNMVSVYVSTHLPAHDFERLWIFKLGDAVQGDIHGHGPRNHFGSTLKAAIAVGDAEAQAIQALLPLFPGGVHIVGVSGNHPRRSTRKDYGGPHDNFDYLVMTQIATRLAAEIEAGRVTVHAPEAWTAYVDVRGKLWALNHGDDVRGFAGHPWYGFSRKNQRVQSLVARAGMRVRYFCYGHFHTSVEMQETDAESLHSGNWTFTDDYAQNALGVGSEPVQPFYVVDDDYGIILKVPIYVRDIEAEERYREGEWEPPYGQSNIMDSVSSHSGGFPVVRAAKKGKDAA